MSEQRATRTAADDVWTAMLQRHRELAAVSPVARSTHRPSVAVLAWSDARVPPSLLFGQEPGSAFVVRLAGNSATPGAIASLTYAVEALEVELVVVLGHTGCGAVAAAIDPPGTRLAETLAPVLTPIAEVLAASGGLDDLDAAVRANVARNVARLAADTGPLGAAVRSGRVTVRGAVHDLATGELVPIPSTTLDPTTTTTITTTITTTTTTTTPTPTTTTTLIRSMS